jgi:hypothetical protein
MPVGDSSELGGRLLSRLPDTARWVETRGSLLTGECELFGDESGCVLRDPGERLLSVIGQVKPCAIRAATDGLEGEWSLICATEVSGAVAGRLPAWAEELAFLHELPMGVVPKAPPVVAALERVERRSAGLLDHLPPSLKAEIARAAGRRPMVAAWLEGRAVSFGTSRSTRSSHIVGVGWPPPVRAR